MLKHMASPSKKPSTRGGQFPTIDEAFIHVEEGYELLKRLKDLKHPLGVRRGVPKSERTAVVGTRTSRTLKAKGKTFFFDLKQTGAGKPYIVITESRLKGEGGKRYRASVAVFPDDARAFGEALEEMIAMLAP
jgi:hypothetical protein